MTITYKVGNGLYVNTTNRCSNSCDFCVRATVENYYGDLWLEREPTLSEIIDAIMAEDLDSYSELVFCGYGEPTYRFDDIIQVCKAVKSRCDIPIRINTNGQGSLICKKDITPEMENLVDCVSISLNTADAVSYQNVCHSEFGEMAYDELLDFASKARKYVKRVVLSVVETTISDDDIEICRKTAEKHGVELRVRELIS